MWCGPQLIPQGAARRNVCEITMEEGPQIAPAEISVQHMQKTQHQNGVGFSNPAEDSVVEYIFAQGGPSFARLRGRSGGRQVPHASVLLASALAIAASLSMVLIWSTLCKPPGNKTGTLGLLQRRLSYSQHGHTLSHSAQYCALLEMNLKTLHNAVWTAEERTGEEPRFVPDVYSSAENSTKEAPCLPQASTGTSFRNFGGRGDTTASALESNLMKWFPPDIGRSSRLWTTGQTEDNGRATATTTQAAEPALCGSAGEWKQGANEGLIASSLAPLWTPQHVRPPSTPGGEMSQFEAMLLHSGSAFERTQTGSTAVARGASNSDLQTLVELQVPTVEVANAASVVPGSAAAYSRFVGMDVVNPPEGANCQTLPDAEETAGLRSRKIRAIEKMLSLAAEEFERRAQGVQGQVQRASCGPVIAQEQPQRAGTPKRAVPLPLVCSSGVKLEPGDPPSMQRLMMSRRVSSSVKRDNKVSTVQGQPTGMSMPRSPSAKAQRRSLLQSDGNSTVSAFGGMITTIHSSGTGEYSDPPDHAASSGGNWSINLQPEPSQAGDSKNEKVPTTKGCDVEQGGIANDPYSESQQNGLQPPVGVHAAPMRKGPLSSVISVSETPSNDAGADSAVVPAAHPFVHLPVVPPEAIKRTFNYRAALLCSIHERTVVPTLRTMRALFAKEVLNWIEVNKLISACERLVNYAFFILQSPDSEMPWRAIRRLGLAFLAFDAMVCTIELLGENMLTGAWWQKFVSAFSTNYYVNEGGKIVRTGRGYAGLCNRLMAALEIYKTGRRPPNDEVILLKRLLFCSNASPTIFQRPEWNVWRLDDKNFVDVGQRTSR